MIARNKETHSDFEKLPEKAVFQMNDTHPTIAVAELMRLLLDQEGLDWDKAWGITVKVHPAPFLCTRSHETVDSASPVLHLSRCHPQQAVTHTQRI